MKKKTFIIFIIASLLFFSIVCKKNKLKKSDEINIGIVTWIGYSPLFIAKEKGIFEKYGLNVNIKVLDGPGQRESTYLSGDINFFPNTPDAFLIASSNGIKGKLVLPMDESLGADGIIAKKSIKFISDLKGKTIGFQNGITSHFFLLYLLDKAGLTGNDIIQQNLGAGEAGAAFVANKLDAAVTWEPWLSKAKEMDEAHVLASSKETPGLLADILMVNEIYLKDNRDKVKKFILAWFESIEYINGNKNESVEIISKNLGISKPDAVEMLSTTHFFDLSESRAYFDRESDSGNIFAVLKSAARLYLSNGVIKNIPDIEKEIDTSILNDLD